MLNGEGSIQQKLSSPLRRTARMAKKVLLYLDQGGLSTAQHSTIPSVCPHRRPFLLGLTFDNSHFAG
jgi:hypothetical protein